MIKLKETLMFKEKRNKGFISGSHTIKECKL